jgi:hypothetical protein
MSKRIGSSTAVRQESFESKGPDFTVGKNHGIAEVGQLHPDDPVSYAKRFLQHRASSVKEEVTADVFLNRGIAAFRKDEEKRRQLLNALVDAKVLSKTEAQLDLDAKKSTLSMLTKIGQYADVILHERIIPFLQPGYSVLYQLALLIEELEASDEQD